MVITVGQFLKFSKRVLHWMFSLFALLSKTLPYTSLPDLRPRFFTKFSLSICLRIILKRAPLISNSSLNINKKDALKK